MTLDETAVVLRLRRDLTGENFNDGTATAWHEALKTWPFAVIRTAITIAAREHPRVNVAHVVEHLPAQTREYTPEGHPRSCMCGGRGFIEVEQRDDHHSWWAWARCPDGPPTGFIEIDA